MRLLIKPHIPGPLANLAISILLASYMFYGFVSIPPDLEQPEVMFWTYAKGKVATGLSYWGGYVGVGHPASLYRTLLSNMEDPVNLNYSLRTNINVTNTEWDEVPVRVYEPNTMVRNGPALVLFHGGLWIMGNTDNHDHVACELAKSMGAVVISVDYRLAPEHPFPLPLEDCYTATKYLLENGRRLYEIDSSMVVLVGIGAGGNLAAAVAQKLRDEASHLNKPAYQVLLNPILQPFDFNTPSYRQNEYDASFPKSLIINAWLWYGLGYHGYRKYSSALHANYHTSASAKQSKMAANVDHNLIHRKYLHESYTPDRVDFGDEEIWSELVKLFNNSYFSPLMAADLKDLPKAYIVVTQYDVVRDDGIMYARRLEKSGVPVNLVHYDKAIHGHATMTTNTDMGRKIITDLVKYLINRL